MRYKKRIGIITWHYFLNFGSALQAFALKKTIENIGHYKVEIINYRNPIHGIPNYKQDLARVLISKLFQKKGYLLGRHIIYPFLRFQYDFLKLRKPHDSSEWLTQYSKKFDCVICGSDQIWAPKKLNPVYLLQPIPNEVRKVSYAASIGFNNIPNVKIELYRTLLKRFYKVSVRENQGQYLLRNLCGINSEIVLDPTLLISFNDWRKVERSPTELNLDLTKPFIFCYFLNSEHDYTTSVLKYVHQNNIQVMGYSLKANDCFWMKNLKSKIGPREFLWLIDKAELVITDSYHCTIFSLLFNTRFSTFKRFKTEDPECQNSRIQQLSDYFDIENHIIDSTSEIYDEKVNFDLFLIKLEDLRKQSLEFLNKALSF